MSHPVRLLLLTTFALALAAGARAEHEGKIQVLLLGDSTTEGSVPRRHQPEGPHLEDTVRLLLAAEDDMPPMNVINEGVSGEFIRRLLDQRYDKKIARLPGIDYIFIRYGINDHARREDFDANFPADFRELLARLRRDHPRAVLIPTTNIPFSAPEATQRMNAAVKQIAEEQKLSLFDLHPRYAAELEHGRDVLNYRRFPLEKIPEKDRAFVQPFVRGNPPKVEVMDNRLDARFRDLPGWFGDRHPNLAGYTVIGDETAKYLAKLIRQQRAAAAASQRLSGPAAPSR